MKRHTIPVLLTTILLATAFPVTATEDGGGDDEGTDYATAWSNLKTLLGAGNVTDARELYNATFAEGAASAPAAEAAIEAGFALAEAGESDLALTKAKQQIDKSLYAVALANVEAHLETGDLAEARDWFGILDAKFGDAVADAAAALDDAEELPTADVAATVRANVEDVALQKVFKEVTETPLILAEGEVVEAVKEAAEARYYYLSTRDAVLATLGEEAESHLVEELDHLLEEAEENEVTEVEAIATEILTILGTHAIAAADNGKADAWLEGKALVGSRTAENLTAAQDLYAREFQDAAERLAPASHERMVQAFEQATLALETGDEIEFALVKQTLDKALYDVAFQATLEALDGNNPDAALVWYKLLATKFKFLDAPADNLHLMELGKAAAANGNADAARPAVVDGTVGVLLNKVDGELSATLEDWDGDVVHSHETAIEAVLYYEPARNAVRAVLGEDGEHELHHEIEEFLEARINGDLAHAEQAAGEIRALLGQYETASLENADLARIVPGLIPTLNLVIEEYVEYFDFMETGDTDKAEAEIAEAHTFIRQVRSTLDKRSDAFEAADADAFAQVLENLDTLDAQLDDRVAFETLEATVVETKSLLFQIAGLEAPPEDEEPEQPSAETQVNLAFGDATAAGDAYVIPVHLVGLPEGSDPAWQITLRYDAEKLAVEKVEAFGDIKVVAPTEPGKVSFNGGIASDAPAEFKVAELRVKPADGVDEVTFDVEVEDLALATGGDLAPGDVTGATVTFPADDATVNQNDDDVDTSKDAPFPGLLAGLTGMALAGAALRRREA